MFSRYRSYTTYSEENGKLVPSIEPMEKKTMPKIDSDEIKQEAQKKLNDGQPPQIIEVKK